MKIISLKISLFFESIFFHTEKFSVNRKQQPRLEKMVKLRKAELIPRPWIYPRRFRYKSVWVIFPLQISDDFLRNQPTIFNYIYSVIKCTAQSGLLIGLKDRIRPKENVRKIMLHKLENLDSKTSKFVVSFLQKVANSTVSKS